MNRPAVYDEATGTFYIPVVQNRLKRNQVTALHLMVGFLLITMGLVTWAIPSALKKAYAFLDIAGLLYMGFGFFLLLISVFFNKSVIQTKKNLVIRILEIIALLPILLYALYQKWYLPAAYSGTALAGIIFAYVWEKNANAPIRIHISKEGIRLPRFLNSLHLKWQDMERVLIKHSILTIDCRDNRLFQYQTLPIDPEEIRKIGDYCSKLVESYKNIPSSDW